MAFELEGGNKPNVCIKVLGIGGGGNNAVNRMVKADMSSAVFIAINTDKQALDNTAANIKIQIGEKYTKGQGAGANPEKGKKAAEESEEKLTAAIQDADMVFIAAGMGGGTGTGGAPVIADIGRSLDKLVVGVVTKPFAFEGPKRMQNALAGIESLRTKVDSLVVIPNERLKHVVDQRITFSNAFEIADDVLKQAIASISDLINIPGMINLDFADVCAIMKNAGYAHMGLGKAQGKDKAKEAAKMAIYSPLLETSIDGAKGVLINIIGSKDLSLDEVDEAANLITQAASPDATIIFGFAIDEDLEDEVRITIIATGFEGSARPATPPVQDSQDNTKEDDPFGDIIKLFNNK